MCMCSVVFLDILNKQTSKKLKSGVQFADLVITAASVALLREPNANITWTDKAALLHSSPDVALFTTSAEGIYDYLLLFRSYFSQVMWNYIFFFCIYFRSTNNNLIC